MPHSTGESYVLSRGYQASSRLNLQALLWHSMFGTDTGLHPVVDETFKSHKSNDSFVFADVATGSGILLLQLADTLEHAGGREAVLHGFDISSEQFPHQAYLPSNVQLFASDATKEPEERFRGKYDVVHVRMMFAAIDGNDPSPVLRHANMLLKPGGVLQWDELDAWRMDRLMADTNETPCLDQIVNIFRFTKQTTWVSNLSKHFASSGYEVLANQEYTPQPWKRHMMMEIWCLVTDEFASSLEASGQIEKAAEVKKLVQGAYSEIRTHGAYYQHKIRVVVGKKALA